MCVVRSVLGFRGESAFGTWLHRVTVNVCLTALPAAQRGTHGGNRRRIHGVRGAGPPGRRGALASDEDVSEQVARHDLATRTAPGAQDLLGDDARTVVVLRDVQGLSTKEVAGMLGVSESVVKVRLHRAHAKLRALVLPVGSAEDGFSAEPDHEGDR